MEIFKRILIHPIHPVFFAFFSTFFLLAKNIGEIEVDQIVQPLLLSVIIGVLVWALINLLVQNRKISAVTTSVLLLMFFSYVHVDRIIFWVHLPVKYYLLFMLGLASLITIWLLQSKRKLVRMTMILNIISFAMLIYPTFVIIYYEIGRIKEVQWSRLSFLSQSQPKEVTKHDIYYIIPDSYASNSTLKDYFNFDNSEFTDYLKNKGFYIAEGSSSNYPFTTPSLASSLNMNYSDEIAGKMGTGSNDFTPLMKRVEDNQVFRYLKSQGYKYYHFGPRLQYDQFNKAADFNYIYESNQLSLTPLTGLLLEQTALAHIVSNVDCTSSYSVFCIGTLNDRRAHYGYLLNQAAKLKDIVGDEGPKFIYYHNLFTHVPYAFAEDGSFISSSVELSRDWKKNYINQLKFTNKAMRQLIDTILKNSKEPPIIILQSDEGPYPERFRKDTTNFEWRRATKDELREKFGILNAYYLPGVEAKALKRTISPVNTFRIIFNEYFGEQLPLLEDISYAQVRFHTPYNVFNVTNLME